MFAEALVSNFGFAAENITTLRGEAATAEPVRAEMQRLAESLTADDQLVFYFAGHGTRRPDQAPRDELDDGLDEALCLYDTTPTGENLLVDDDLREWLGTLASTRVTVILDCCHSGTGTKDPESEYTPRFLTLATTPAPEGDSRPWGEVTGATKSIGTRLVALYACSNDQSAYERRFYNPTRHRGQFTHYLLQAMSKPEAADANGDGKLSVEETAEYISSRIDKAFNQKSRDPKRQQTPRFESARPSWELIAREA